MSEKQPAAAAENPIRLTGSHLKDCPPQAAVSKTQTYFRVLVDGVLKKENFVPRAYLPPKGKFKETCDNCALSLCPTVTDAESLIATVASFRNGKIASVAIEKDHGRIHDNRSNHSNWWHPEDFDPVKISRKLGE